ncbi:hypothetical protein BJX61DRAFT_542570 [Aspergillus egyptiacus]|nr:hypothetical protein BJX61DRAFT_542570 [Aspergillus egyptiacus]
MATNHEVGDLDMSQSPQVHIGWDLGMMTANLDFDARVPIPFSVFPSSYRSDAVSESASALVTAGVDDQDVSLDHTSHVEREDTRTPAPLPDPRVYGKEEVDLRLVHRPSDDLTVVADERAQSLALERYSEPTSPRYHQDTNERAPTPLETQLDITEREYRRRVDPTYEVNLSHDHLALASRKSIEAPPKHVADVYPRSSAGLDVSYDHSYQPPTLEVPSGVSHNALRRVSVEPLKPTLPPPPAVKVLKTTTVVNHPSARKMGYYDDDGNYHSFRRGVERAVDRITHPSHHREHEHTDSTHDHPGDLVVADERGPVRFRDGVREDVRVVEPRNASSSTTAETVPIPCHFVRIGDILILQGRPCQVIRISVSPQTGQHRYLGVDLFTKELHEESSFISNPSPSVVVQTMLGPVYKTYRILDIREDNSIVAMTENGDVKQGLPVVNQANLYKRMRDAFLEGRGSVRALIINDGGRELVVDFKVVHASRL